MSEKKFVKSEIKLTIGILVSNRIRHIRAVMEGIKPLLNAIPSELIAIDTKGTETDGSLEIVREYTDKIYSFVWCDDFSAARNVCLEHANGEWFMYLDDDEVFEDVQEIIEFFKSDACNQYLSASYHIRNYSEDGSYSVAVAERMVRRTANTRFTGRIHERLNEFFQPNKVFASFVHHYGYAFETAEEAEAHQKRNVSLLRKELDTFGYTPHLCAQMTQELIWLESSSEEGFQFANQALSVLQQKDLLRDTSSQYIMYATVLYYLRKQETKAAAEQISTLQQKYPLLETTCMVFCAILADLALEEKRIDAMLVLASDYLKLWDWRCSYPAVADAQTVYNFSNYCTEEFYHHMIHMGGAAANRLGQYVRAKTFWDRLPLKRPGFSMAMYRADIQETLDGIKNIGNIAKNQIQLDEIKDVLKTLREAVEFLSECENTALREELETSKKELEELLEAKFKCPVRAWIETQTLSDTEWLREMNCLIDNLKEPLIPKNCYDRDFLQLTGYLQNHTVEEIFKTILEKYEALKHSDSDLYDAMSNYFQTYTFWGSLDPERGIYDAFRNRAKTLKHCCFEFIWLYKKLNDYQSKRTLYAILMNWAFADMELLKEVKSPYKDYFEPDIFPDNRDDVFVDLGAYTGDSVYNYIRTYGDLYKTIYGYEIIPENCEQFRENLKEYHDVVLRPVGVGAEAGIMSLVSNGDLSAGRVEKNQTMENFEKEEVIPIVTLDDDIKESVSFIKMDIEGAERDALLGAQNIIREQKPKLAVCLYHGYDELWSLPRLIEGITPEYEFYLRHYGDNIFPTEFVLLCR